MSVYTTLNKFITQLAPPSEKIIN